MNIRLLLRIVLACSLLSGGSLPAQAQEAKPQGIKLLSSDQHGLTLQVNTPEYQVEQTADGLHSLSAFGAQPLRQPGDPALPIYSVLVAAPPGAGIELELMSEYSLILPQVYPLAVQAPLEEAPQAFPEDPAAAPAEIGLLIPQAFSSGQPAPATLARIADEAWVGGLRLARIEIAPFQYHPADGQVTWHPSLRLSVRFQQPAAASAVEPSVPAPARPYDALLANAVLNYDQAQSWRAAPQELPMFPAIPTTPSGARTRIVVEQDALYRLTAADLAAAGYNLATLDPRKLRLYNQGREVAILIPGESDGRFDPADQLIFYGQKVRGDVLSARYAVQDDTWPLMGEGWQPQLTPLMIEKYTRQNVYWLTAADTPGLRMSALPQNASGTQAYTNPTTLRLEESTIWWTSNITSEETWFWERIQNFTLRSYAFNLVDPINVGSATVRGEVAARTASPTYNPDHRTRVTLNTAYLVEDALWDGKVRHTFEGQVAQSGLVNGPNSLQFQAIQAYANEPAPDLYFDWFEITYERLLTTTNDELAFFEDQAGDWHYQTFGFNSAQTYVVRVNNPLSPAWALLPSGSGMAEFKVTAAAGDRFFLAGANALRAPLSVSAYTPPDLLSASNGADYIIITAPEFAAAAERLADQREAQGLQTRILLFEDLVNQFNEGIYHPLAIKSFLSYAYSHWNPAPSYVVLIGDGHTNFLNYNPDKYGSVNPIFLPPNLEFVDFTNGEIDATNNLANIVGADVLADLAIGRIPVNSVAELNVVIDKILSYENGALNQPWQRRVMFVADNTPDEAGDFVAFSNDLVMNHLPAPFQADKVYLNDLSCPVDSPSGSCTQASAALVNGLSDPGALFVSYIGHGHIARWTNERVFTNEIATTTANLARLPVTLAMTCYDGYWGLPSKFQPTSLEEVLLLHPNGGTVSGFAATGWGTTYDHHLMERGIFQAVFTHNVDRLGLATESGKLALYSAGSGNDVLQTFLILGDPALKLHLPPRAAFSATPTSGYGVATVSFTNQSTGDYTTQSWNFGDGSPASNQANPTHTYASEGVYTVTLTVSDGAGSTDSEVKTGYIVILMHKIMLPVVLR